MHGKGGEQVVALFVHLSSDSQQLSAPPPPPPLSEVRGQVEGRPLQFVPVRHFALSSKAHLLLSRHSNGPHPVSEGKQCSSVFEVAAMCSVN